MNSLAELIKDHKDNPEFGLILLGFLVAASDIPIHKKVIMMLMLECLAH